MLKFYLIWYNTTCKKHQLFRYDENAKSGMMYQCRLLPDVNMLNKGYKEINFFMAGFHIKNYSYL